VIPPRSLRFRAGIWIFAATAGVAVLLTVYYHHRTDGLLKLEFEERFATFARHAAATAPFVLNTLARDEKRLAESIEGVMSQPDVEAVAVYEPGGAVIAARSRDGGAAPAWGGPPPECRPCSLDDGRLRWVTPVASAPADRERGVAHATDRGDVYLGPPPAATGGNPAGWLVLDVSTSRLVATERRLTANAVLISVGALVLALALTLVLAQGLTSPLRALAQATREIGKGRWDAPLPNVRSTTEIVQLNEDLRAMTAALAALDKENRRYREDLENMVASRTAELENAYERMKAMAEAKDQFVATVSHDFRSPLAIILSAVQTVLADRDMREDVRREFLTRAERQCKRLGTLVNDLLDLARIENRDTRFEAVQLAQIVEEVVEGARAAFDERRVALGFQQPIGGVVAEVDRGQIGRAVSNLVDNALKFTPPGGRVTVQLRRDEREAIVSVADTGPGIPEDEREHVFERFFQGQHGRALGRGSGLGLAIVAGVARRHGGRVDVTSAPGGGATFELRVPLTRR
jgi:signal transduction histidine kinase